jgi:photosystem II stability/assembly factor-like uncharacterized protein
MKKYLTFLMFYPVWVFLFFSLINFESHAQNGSGWSILPIQGDISDMEVISGFSFEQTPIYQSTTSGAIRKSTNGGFTWITYTTGVSSIQDISFYSENVGWAVSSGKVLRTTNGGVSWTIVDVAPVNLRSVKFFTSLIGWAVGESGFIYKSTNGGVSWALQTSNTNQTLHKVTTLNSTTAIAVGDRSVIVKTSDGGTTWTLRHGGSNGMPKLYDVDVFINIGYSVGENGTILRTLDDGNTWNAYGSGTTSTLRGVDAMSSGRAFACGDNGKVLKKGVGTNSNWESTETGRMSIFYSIQSHYDFNGEEPLQAWVAGSGGIMFTFTGGVGCVAPTIASQPQSVTVCEGQSAILSATINGTQSTIKWKRNGVFISALEGPVLTITNITPSSAGNYEVVVTSPCGDVTSSTRTITVTPLTQPSVITGSANPQTILSNTYSVSPMAGASFNWSAGTGSTITGSGNTVQITWSSTGARTISVSATSACGTSIARTLAVNVSACATPVMPSFSPSPSTASCTGGSSVFSVTAFAGINYSWTVSGGGTITSSGNTATVNWTSTGSHTITVIPSTGCGNGTPRTVVVNVAAGAAQPSVISGNALVCTGVSTPYSVTNVAGVTYTWNTGGGGTITGSGNAINVTWTSAGAKALTVTPSTACGSGTPRTLAVTVNTVPSQPSVIAGSTTVATGSSNQFSVTNEAGVTYAWNAGTGGTVTGSGNSVSISWSSAGSKTITLTPSNACGNGTARTLNVTVNDCAVPAQPSTITGNATACIGAGTTYSVMSVGGVSYAWSAGVDGSVVGTGNSVTLSWTSAGSKTITVTPFNACGNGIARTLNITLGGVPAQPSSISGNITACKDAATAYSVTNVASVTYSWSTGDKGTVSGSGNSVNVTWTNLGTNTLVVTPSNACGNGSTQTLTVTTNKVPDPVGDITGSLSGCANTAIPFSVGNVSGVTYTWNGGAGSSASNTSNSPTITWTTNGSKTLTVTPSNACGNGTGASKTVEITPASAQPSAITGSATPTAGVAEMYSVSHVSGTTYTWNGGTGATVIGVGNSVQISWASAGTKTISVTPSNLCGAGTVRTLNVTVGSAPCTAPVAPASITAATNFPTGSIVAFTSALVSGATSYTFSVAPSTGISIANTGNAHEKNITFANAGTYVVSAAAVNACGATSVPALLTVLVCDFPVILPTGLTSIGASCIGKKQRYSVNVVNGFTYEWSATNGTATNVSNGVADITWNNASFGQVYVRAVNACGVPGTVINGPMEALIANPTAISLTNNLVGGYCDGKVVTWTINSPEAGVNYTWVADRPITTTATTVTATINGPMDLRLFATNTCATNFQLTEISGGNPFPIPTTAPGIISGTLNPVVGQLTTYTIPNESSPFRLSWDYGSGIIELPPGTASFDALIGTAGSKTLTVKYLANASCGNIAGPAQTLNVVAVNPCVIPDQPGPVSGLSVVCANTEYGFSVPFVAEVDYNWSAGADATMTGTLNNRTIKWSTGGAKTISVTASKSCGTSTARTLSVTVTTPPVQPATLTGSVSGCSGATQQISLASPVAGVTYTWEVQAGTVVTSGAQGQIADITWTSLGVSEVKLKPSNACGNGTPRTLSVTVGTVPDQPSFIAGENEVCSATSKAYSVTNVAGVTYTWNAGSGGTVTGSGNAVSISWSTTGSKTITLTPSNACGNGTARTLTVNVGGVPAQPAAISGLASPVLGNEEAYSVTSVAGVNYVWSLSDKGTLTGSGNNATVFWSTSGGATLSVTPSNTCGNGTARTASININKITQTITFTVLSPVVANQPLTLNGSASSGLPIAYTSSNTSVAEIFGSELIIKGSGTINLTASQAGDATFAAASPVVRALTINRANQTITFAALSAATFSAGDIELAGTSDSDLPVAYSSSNTSVATVSGNSLVIVGAGSTNITASQGGNAIFNAATPVVRALTVNKADQTISFEPLAAKGINDPPFSLSATASSGLAVTYTSSNTSVATVSGTTVMIISQGTTTIMATQSGNTNYNAALPVNQVLTVNGKQSQSITFNSIVAKTFGDVNFTLSATASSNLTVSYSSSNTAVATVNGNAVTIVGAGSTEITASQAGDATFNPATSVQQPLVVNKANQAIAFEALAAKNITDPSFTLSASASSGLSVSYASSNISVATVSGNTVTIVGPGTTTITASQSGSINFNAATSVEQELRVNSKQDQTISFDALAARTFGAANFNLVATASSGLPISYSSSNTAVATVTGNMVSIVGAGTTVITASQTGDAMFHSAVSVEQTLLINKADQIITFAALPNRGVTQGGFALTATTNSLLPLIYTSSNPSVATITGDFVTVVGVGTTNISASQNGNGNYNPAPTIVQSLTIIDDNPTRILTISGAAEFGDVIVPNASSKTIVISNTGNSPLTISKITYPEGFDGDTNPGLVLAGSSLQLKVTFRPTEAIDYAGSIIIQSNATSGTSSVIAKGKGVLVTAIADDFNQLQPILIFPNPAHDIVSVEVDKLDDENISVVDGSGRLVESLKLSPISPKMYQTNVSQLAQGIYYLKLSVNKKSRMVRLIKTTN